MNHITDAKMVRKTIALVNPKTGKVVGHVARGNGQPRPEGLDAAIRRARKAARS